LDIAAVVLVREGVKFEQHQHPIELEGRGKDSTIWVKNMSSTRVLNVERVNPLQRRGRQEGRPQIIVDTKTARERYNTSPGPGQLYLDGKQ
jgi:hypothetical protein